MSKVNIQIKADFALNIITVNKNVYHMELT